MPMLDAYIPEGSLSADAERDLMANLTNLLIQHEGADPANPAVQSLAWVFLHRPTRIFVGGVEAAAPHYRFIASVPEGQFNKDRRAAMITAVTNAVLDAEDGAHPRQPERVWVFTPEVPEGSWGFSGRVFGLADIAGYALGDDDAGTKYAGKVFADRRQNAISNSG